MTLTVHEPFAGIVAPESATVLPAPAAVTVPPTQVVAPAGVAVFARPAGYVSVNAAPVTATLFVFASVSVSTDGTFMPTAAGAKAFASVGCASTVRVAVGPATVPAFVVVMLPTGFG